MNYLVRAQKYFSENNNADTLFECRRALENLINILWRKLEINKQVIKVKKLGPTRDIELLSLTSSVRKGLEDLKLEEDISIIKLLAWFEGLDVKYKTIWNYLNGGTHEEEEREDFDPVIVGGVLDNTISLDTLLKPKK